MDIKTFRVFIEDTQTKKRHTLMIESNTREGAAAIAQSQLRVTDLKVRRVEQAHYGK